MEHSYGVQQIALERKRQVTEEEFDAAHDDGHQTAQLAKAAECYLREPRFRPQSRTRPPQDWPWRMNEWKPSTDDRERELVKAGALIAAELDRLHRLWEHRQSEKS